MSNTYMPLYGVFDTATGALQGVCPVSGITSSVSGQPVSITGTTTVGSVLTAALAAGWTAGGYQWTRDGANISGATSSTYTLVSADSGHTVGVTVSTLVYAPTGQTIAAATPVAPTITAVPVISAITAGSAVTWTTGTATGTPTPTLTYALKKNGTVVSSPATSGAYSSTTAGDIFIVTLTATNTAGSASQDSSQVTVTSGATLRAAAATNFINQNFQSMATASATSVDIYDRIYGVLGATIPSITLGFANNCLKNNSGVNVPGNGYTIQAVAIVIGGVSQPVLFSGGRTASVTNGQNLLSDALAASAFSLSNFAQGTTFEIRYRITLTAPSTDKWCYSASTSINAIESGRRLDPTKVVITNGVDSTGAYAYTMTGGGVDGTDAVALGVRMRPIVLGSHSGAAVGFWGDSKTYGVGDTASAVGALGLNRALYPNPASATGAKSGINFGCSSGIAVDCTTAVGAATLSMLTYWYQYCNNAVVGYGTNAFTQSAQTALHSQIRTAGISKIIQRSLTPRTTVPSISITNLVRTGTACTATVASTASLVDGNQYAISGATPSQYNGVFTIHVVDGTTFTYTALSTPGSSPAGNVPVVSTSWATTADQTVVAGWSAGGAAETFETFLKTTQASDANMTYYQSQGERAATSGTNYWIWKANGTPNLETSDGLHESAQGYEDNIGIAGTATTIAGGTVSTTLRALVQAL